MIRCRPSSARLFELILMVVLMAFPICSAQSQSLTWIGGTGTWDNLTPNWSDGSQHVNWQTGGNAVFSGQGATVTSTFPGPVVSSMTFDSPGHRISSGWVVASSAQDLVITTQGNATISSTLSGTGSSRLVKRGNATLTVAGTNFLQNLRIEEGEYEVTGSSSLFFSNVHLDTNPGTVLTLGGTSTVQNIRSLSGGGTVRPNAQPRTVEAQLWAGGSYGGSLQDHGGGRLALTIFAPSGTVELTAANTYSGATNVTAGTLTLKGLGTIQSPGVTVSHGGAFNLDNTVTALTNRLPDSSGLVLQSGLLQLIGHPTAAIDELVGQLRFSGASSIQTTPGGGTARLGFSGAVRELGGTLDINGGDAVGWAGLANGSTGIVAPYITAGNDWAVTSPNHRVEPFLSYLTDINYSSPGDHIQLISGGTTMLSGSATRASLNISSPAGGSVLDLDAAELTLTSGGLLTSGSGSSVIQSGALSTGGEFVVTNRNTLTVSSSIAETTAGTMLTKTGTGTLILSGSNTFSGSITLNQGTLAVFSDANLGTGPVVFLNGGSLTALGSFSSDKSLSSSNHLSGSVNTNGFDVLFSGPSTGSLSKAGSGRLMLTDSGLSGFNVSGGTLVLPNTLSGEATLQGGELEVSGTIGGLSVLVNSTLDIGGGSASTLTTSGLRIDGPPVILNVPFGIGSSESDLWVEETSYSLLSLSGTILFDFHNLGGVQTGVDYVLIQSPQAFSAPDPSKFGFSGNSSSSGWAGSISTSANSVTVQFTSVPETSPLGLVALAVLLFGALACRFRNSGF